MEFRYALGLIKTALQARRERSESEIKVKALDVIEKGINASYNIPIHVACFAVDGDVLSLWRGYCPPGSPGFSIGLEQSQLLAAASRQNCFLAPCLYDVQRQTNLVNRLIDDFFEDAIEGKRLGLNTRDMTVQFFIDCVLLSCVLKHPSFEEESEWRIVTHELPDSHPQIGVRSGKIVPIPYFKFQLAEPAQGEVTVTAGPNPEMNLSLDAVKALLAVHGWSGSARGSTVPYREI